MSDYIEPRLRRDFGGIVTAFFNFMKANIKGLINVFIGYNGIFFILFLISVYFMITGIVEYLILESSLYGVGGGDKDSASLMIGIALVFLILLIALATIFNYSISSSYLSLYETEKTNNLPKKQVWNKAKKAFWGVFVLGLCAVVLYFIYFIGQIVLAFIPIVGTIASVVIGLGFNAWISLSIFSYIHNENHNIFDAFGEAWQLLFSGFWKTIGVNFVLGFLVQICLLALQIGPAIIVGLITFHAIENSGDFTDSTFSHILIILIVTLFCIMIMFMQLISQVINGFLYFNLHEFKHNVYLRSRIDNIGVEA
ncbi:hypothetical protein SAMN05192588_1365 [Nonlabens sp. Hel1_33_55]|uniref:hypothetical protein n=1 Tax=Nonlabens sp. Hel1_33_55 TaxID=1336802 RepID=UPI000875B239|nr:hypothetical protein [Nonlabens sp. Hel1_33_55]SCY14440.1 hypothetical protein SAMN05192588_1365 [Nonlabens sp. Hel1_33_55]